MYPRRIKTEGRNFARDGFGVRRAGFGAKRAGFGARLVKNRCLPKFCSAVSPRGKGECSRKLLKSFFSKESRSRLGKSSSGFETIARLNSALPYFQGEGECRRKLPRSLFFWRSQVPGYANRPPRLPRNVFKGSPLQKPARNSTCIL